MSSEGVFRQIRVIAEVAQSYEGSFDLALESVRAAAQAGADVVNFQIFEADELAVPAYQYYPLYKKLELPMERWARLIEEAHRSGMKVMANIFGPESAARLVGAGIDIFKIHNADVENSTLLERLGPLGRPVLVSTSGSTLGEVYRAIRTLETAGAPEVALILGFQNSPTALPDTHLNRIRLIKEHFGLPVGYADHVDAEDPMAMLVPIQAVGAGADFIEKHINLDRSLKREDYISALNPAEFRQMVLRLKDARACMGVPGGSIGEGEDAYRQGMKKRVVCVRNLPAGHRIQREDIALLRSDEESEVWTIDGALGRSLKKPKSRHDVVAEGDFGPKPVSERKVAAILLCRAASSRLYAKPLQRVGAQTILEHLVGQLRLVRRIDEIVLAISREAESRGFVEWAAKLKLPYVFGDEEDGLGRMLEAVDFSRADTVFRVTTENPFLHHAGYEALIDTHFSERADLTVCENLPEGSYAEVIEAAALRRAHIEGAPESRTAWVSLYIARHPEKFKIVRLQPPEHLRRPEIRLTVDYPEDLIVARKIHSAYGRPGAVPLEWIIDFLDRNPDVKALNGRIESGAGRIWECCVGE